jgi:glutaredoxin 3
MYEEISLDAHPDFRQRLVELSGRWTVPQIIVDGTPIGGFSELRALERSGDLAA